MKKNCLLRFSLFLGIVSILATSCKEADIDLSNVSEEVYLPQRLAFPIGKSEVNLWDLLKNESFGSDELNLETIQKDIVLQLSTDATLEYRQGDIDLSGVSVTLNPALTANFDLVGEDALFFNISGIDSDIEIDSIAINTMRVELTVTTENISDADKNKLRITTSFPAESIVGEGGVVSESHDLSNGTLEFSDFSILLSYGTDINQMKIKAEVFAEEPLLSITSASSIKIRYEIVSASYNTVWGNIPPSTLRTIEKREPFDLSVLDGFAFLDPRLEISAKSNVGAQFAIVLDSLVTYYEDSSEGEKAKFYPGGDKDNWTSRKAIVTEARATRPGEVVSILTDYKLNKDSVNIVDLFTSNAEGKMPNELEYRFSIEGAAVEAEHNFMTSDAFIDIDIKAIVPLYVRISDDGFNYADSIKIDMSNALPQNITPDTLLLQLEVVNGLPAGFLFEITDFFDEDGNKVADFYEDVACTTMKTLFGNRNSEIIPAPRVNPDGTVNRDNGDLKETIVSLYIKEDTYEALRKLRSIGYKIGITPPDLKDAHFTIDDTISIEARVYLKADVKISDFEDLTDEE